MVEEQKWLEKRILIDDETFAGVPNDGREEDRFMVRDQVISYNANFKGILSIF